MEKRDATLPRQNAGGKDSNLCATRVQNIPNNDSFANRMGVLDLTCCDIGCLLGVFLRWFLRIRIKKASSQPEVDTLA